MRPQLWRLRNLEHQVEKLAAKAALHQEVEAPDPVLWAESILGSELDLWQADLMQSNQKRELLLCSRQVGKTEICALRAAYTARTNPGSRILTIAPSHRQSRNLFARIAYALNVDASVGVERSTQTEMDLSNGSTIRALPGNDPNRVRGLVADLVLVDEAAFASDSVLTVMFPMLSTTSGTLVMLSTPSGPSGLFHDAWTGDADWHRVQVLAQDCPRISTEFLEEARQRLGDLAYRQEYLCEFIQSGSAFFSADLINEAFEDPEPLTLIQEAFN